MIFPFSLLTRISASKREKYLPHLEALRWIISKAQATDATLFRGLAVSSIAAGLLPMAIILLLSRIIDSFSDRDGGFLVIGILLALLVVLMTAAMGMEIYRNFAQRRLADQLNFSVTKDLLEHADTLDLSFYEDPSSQNM
ncbi:MAG: ABC transporter ATP-binding protein, partial [Magnetococcales bacterium]|nr:ABC transporter ATP-binding protein [Magnetococcales bacterium]